MSKASRQPKDGLWVCPAVEPLMTLCQQMSDQWLLSADFVTRSSIAAPSPPQPPCKHDHKTSSSHTSGRSSCEEARYRTPGDSRPKLHGEYLPCPLFSVCFTATCLA